MENLLKDIKILYIDDEEYIRSNAVEYLGFYCDHVYSAKDGAEGLEVYKDVKPDIIISDIKMPKMNGLEMIRSIRKKDKNTKMIIITAFLNTSYLLDAVELGLVKYLVKPVTHNRLIDILLKCIYDLSDGSNILSLNKELRFDIYNKVLFRNDEIVELTKNELRCLALLLKNKNRAVTYEELNHNIWQGDMSEDSIKCLIRDIRKKTSKQSIKNISGIGYKINIV